MRIKQVILVRKDLKMRRGKEIAQGSHASSEFILAPLRAALEQGGELVVELSQVEKNWIAAGMAKICLKVNSEDELLSIHSKAKALGLRSSLIRDSGRTEFNGVPTYTACAIGPDGAELIDKVTGGLTLY